MNRRSLLRARSPRSYSRCPLRRPRCARAAEAPTVEDARAFLEDAEKRLLALSVDASRAGWVQSNFITDDTEILAALANERVITASAEYAKRAASYDGAALAPEPRRKMILLKNSLTLAAPANPKESEELTQIVARLEGTYGKGKYCPKGSDKCLDLEDITKVLATCRDPKQIEDVWNGWHTIAIPMKKDFARYVELANKGARELGFRGHGRDVAVEVRHASGRLREGARPALGAGASALRLTPRLRALEAPREVRRRGSRHRVRSRRTCSATCGRRTGRTSTDSSLPKTRTAATT